MKPEKRSKLREGDEMPLSPKGKRRANRVSRRNDKVALQDYIGGYIVRTGPREDDNA